MKTMTDTNETKKKPLPQGDPLPEMDDEFLDTFRGASPGPWHLEQFDSEDRFSLCDKTGQDLAWSAWNDYRPRIEEGDPDLAGYSRESYVASFELMAAAPDLLAEVIRLREWVYHALVISEHQFKHVVDGVKYWVEVGQENNDKEMAEDYRATLKVLLSRDSGHQAVLIGDPVVSDAHVVDLIQRHWHTCELRDQGCPPCGIIAEVYHMLPPPCGGSHRMEEACSLCRKCGKCRKDLDDDYECPDCWTSPDFPAILRELLTAIRELSWGENDEADKAITRATRALDKLAVKPPGPVCVDCGHEVICCDVVDGHPHCREHCLQQH